MTAPKVKPNALPVSFDQFRKNPIAAVAFCMLVAVSYLYFDLRSGYKEQIEIDHGNSSGYEELEDDENG